MATASQPCFSSRPSPLIYVLVRSLIYGSARSFVFCMFWRQCSCFYHFMFLLLSHCAPWHELEPRRTYVENDAGQTQWGMRLKPTVCVLLSYGFRFSESMRDNESWRYLVGLLPHRIDDILSWYSMFLFSFSILAALNATFVCSRPKVHQEPTLHTKWLFRTNSTHKVAL